MPKYIKFFKACQELFKEIIVEIDAKIVELYY